MKTWWLLAMCGALEAIYALMNFFTQRAEGSLALRSVVNSMSTVVHMGELALAAGICAMAAGLWSSKKSWPLVINGLALSALGSIFAFWTGPLAFRTVALLIFLMAASIGIFELRAGEWLQYAAGAVSVGFALVFFGFVLRWIKLEPGEPQQSLHWMGAYFAFSAVCMLGLALRRTPEQLT